MTEALLILALLGALGWWACRWFFRALATFDDAENVPRPRASIEVNPTDHEQTK